MTLCICLLTGVMAISQPSVGTTNFNGLIATNSILTSTTSSALSADLYGTGWDLTIQNIIITSTCQIIGDSDKPDRDDLLQVSLGEAIRIMCP
jgi:hypothetical protein